MTDAQLIPRFDSRLSLPPNNQEHGHAMRRLVLDVFQLRIIGQHYVLRLYPHTIAIDGASNDQRKLAGRRIWHDRAGSDRALAFCRVVDAR